MSEEKPTEGKPSENSEVEKRLEELERTNARLLDESKDYKSKWQNSRDELEAAKREKLEAEGNVEAQLQASRDEVRNLNSKLRATTDSALRQALRTEALKHAKDAHDIDMVLKVSEHKKLLDIDEENLTVAGMEDFVKKVRESHSYLFSKSSLPTTTEGKPSTTSVEEPLTDKDKYAEELRNCKTQKEFDAVRKKWGRSIYN